MRFLRYKNSASQDKTTYEKDIFWGSFANMPTWKHIKHIEFQDDDMIQMNYDDRDDCYCVSVVRWIEETDEEWQERLADMKESEDRVKENRRQRYLRLKKEFEAILHNI